MSALGRNLLGMDRISVITDTINSLNIRMRELERLRDQVKKAEKSARRSRPRFPKKRARN